MEPSSPNIQVGAHRYESVLDATCGLLGEVTLLLSGVSSPYIVMGGWCPYLRNTRRDVPHPGTKDVDLLFRDADVEHGLRDIVPRLIEAGYYLSAKHPFQLLRGLRVAKDVLWFNVDLMHPSESKHRIEFVDHFEFDIPDSLILRNVVKAKSIGIPTSRFLFEGYWNHVTASGRLPSGDVFSHQVPLIDAAGLVLSKCESMKSLKRPRDAFDVYLMLIQDKAAETTKQLRAMAERFEDLQTVYATVGSDLLKPHTAANFDNNVREFCPAAPHPSPSEVVRQLFDALATKDHA